MSKLPRKRSKPKAFSGSHQRSWLWGRHAVIETLQAGKWPILELYANSETFKSLEAILAEKSCRGFVVEIVSTERLFELTHSTEHQGLVARLGTYPYLGLDPFIAQLQSQSKKVKGSYLGSSPETNQSPLVVICDRIQDAFNFGAILRCCDGASAIAVVVGESSQAEVTPHVARSSSGAVNYVPIVKTGDLMDAAKQIRNSGLQLVAADPSATTSVWEANLNAPTALIIGSEAHGIEAGLLAECDFKVSIPMRGRIQSLNAAVATGILLYEIRRQQV